VTPPRQGWDTHIMATTQPIRGQSSMDSIDSEISLLPSKKLGNIRGPMDLFIYLKSNPSMIGLFLTIFVSLAFTGVCGGFYYIDYHRDTVFFCAGVAGIAFNVYKMNHFRELMVLKKEINKYSKANANFRAENNKLMEEIARFEQAQQQLGGVRKTIRRALKRQKKTLGKFRHLNTNLSATGKGNLKALGDLNEMVGKMQDRWAEELKKRERKVLSVIFDRVEMEDDEVGLSLEEFQYFKDHLPESYQVRMAQLGTWQQIAGDDGVLEFHEFQQLMDDFVNQVVVERQKSEQEKWKHEAAEEEMKNLSMDSGLSGYHTETAQ